MKTLVKYIILPFSLLFAVNVSSQELSFNERERIELECHEKNERNIERVRAFGDNSITSEQLLEQCIRNATEISLFNSTNTIENTEELYEQTIIRLDAKLNELRNSKNSELNGQYACFSRQRYALNFAKNVGDNFLRRALITTNSLLNNNCVR
jgi:hypothetical protein